MPLLYLSGKPWSLAISRAATHPDSGGMYSNYRILQTFEHCGHIWDRAKLVSVLHLMAAALMSFEAGLNNDAGLVILHQ